MRAERSATGATAGDGTAGAQLRLWSGGRWEILDNNVAPSDAAADVTWSSANAGDVTKAIFRGDIHFGVQSVGSNGTGTATVAADYFEAEVLYRLPPP